MNTYRRQFIAECPSDGEWVVYTLQIETPQKVMVEHINTAVKVVLNGYQEDIAQELRGMFPGRLTLEATHQGVNVKTVLEEPTKEQP